MKGDIIFIVIVSEYKQIYCERLGIITGPFRSFIRLTECRVGRKLIRQFFSFILFVCASLCPFVCRSASLHNQRRFPVSLFIILRSVIYNGYFNGRFQKNIHISQIYTIYTHMGTCNTQGFNFEFIF